MIYSFKQLVLINLEDEEELSFSCQGRPQNKEIASRKRPGEK